MKSDGRDFPASSSFDDGGGARNPFGVMDVPSPDDGEVRAFAAAAEIVGSPNDENAAGWSIVCARDQHGIEGVWSSRWNGGVDATIPGDAKDKWKQGRAEVRTAGDRVYLLFDWGHDARRGPIDARRAAPKRLVGKYVNLTDPAITRPWIGLIVSDCRIDGSWVGGRLDFRR
jgi:hypothetical protein